MVQRWIKAASPTVHLANLSQLVCPKSHSDAGRGRRRNNVSEPKNICHAISLFPGQAIAQPLLSLPHPLSLALWWKDTPHPDSGLVCFNASSYRQISMRRAAKGKRVFHFMVTEYILLALKSAHQTLGPLQETSTFQRLQRRALPIAAG